MTAYILRRILYLIPTFFGATFLAFLIIQLAPGDYLTQLELDPKVTPETIARLRAQFGLDRPIYEQYLLWMDNLLHLNLGYSFAYQAPVLEVIWPRVVNSMVIVIPSTLLLYLVAIPIGVYGAVRQYSLGDRILSFLAYIGLSVPSFFLALIAIYAAASLARHIQGPPRPYADLRGFGLDFLVALTACVFTPHHVFGLIFPLTYLQNALSGKATFLTNISEWQSAGFDTPLGSLITYYLMFCLFAIFGSGTVPSPVHVGLLVAFGFFAFTTIRNIPLLGIAATPVLARHLPRALSNAWKLLARVEPLRRAMERLHRSSVDLDRRAHWLPVPLLFAAFMVVAAALPARSPLSFQSLTGVRSLADLSPSFYPQGLLEYLAENGQGRRVFNYFNWGGAFIHRLYPNLKVFIDQRNDCYPMTVFEDYFAVHELGPDWRTVLDRWRIDAVAYPPDSALAKTLAQDPAWRVEYRDAQAVLFARAASGERTAPVTAPPDIARPSSPDSD